MADESLSDTAAVVRQYIVDNFLYVRPDYPFADSDSLFGSGIIDSFGATELIAYLEERFGILIEDHEVTEEHLGTVAAIARFAAGKVSATTNAPTSLGR